MRKLVLVVGVLVVFALPGVSAATTAAAVNVVHISAPASGLRYTQTTVHAHAGRIKIVFTNHSALKHNVNVEKGEQELGKSATISHSTTTMFVTLKAGKYNFYCSVPGHEAAGMHGTLIVT